MKSKNIEKLIKQHAQTEAEREELWRIVDEIVHHRVMGCILDSLDKKHHEDFLGRLAKNDFEIDLIEYLEDKTDKKAIKKIQEEIQKIESEILNELT